MSDEFVMSEGIEALAATLNDALENFYEPFDWHEATRISARILAAGYAKPRQITTVEELDALGREAVLRDDNGQLFEQNWMLATPDDMWWENLSERGNTKQSPALPATVLWEPLP